MSKLEQSPEEPIFTGLQCPPHFKEAGAELIDFKDLLCRYLSKNLAHGLFEFEFDTDGCLMATRNTPECGAFAHFHLWKALEDFLRDGLHVQDIEVLPEFDGEQKMVDIYLESARARTTKLFGNPSEERLSILAKEGKTHEQFLERETQDLAEHYARIDHRKKQLDALWQWIFDHWGKIRVRISPYLRHVQSIDKLREGREQLRTKFPYESNKILKVIWDLERKWKENQNS